MHPIRPLAFALAVFALGAASPAPAQSPTMKVILPVSVGSGVDTIVRTLQPALARALGQTIVIENLPGAGGVTGTHAIVKAPADGNSIGVISSNHVINPHVFKTMPFDSIADITPISVLGETPLVLVVNAKVPARNLAALLEFLRAKPGAYHYASSGNGTILHLAGAMFAQEAGVDIKHVPYKGVAPMVNDLLGAQVELGILALPAIQGHLRSGALRAIGMTGRSRSAAAPEIPTLAEQGLRNYEVTAWFAVIGPPRLAPEQVRRIHGAFVAALATPEVREAMERQGNMIAPSTPEAALQTMRAEVARYGALVQKIGLKPE